ncbi:uncharacterized protein LOC143589524 [Bidens hawaiensis]|uniref:uncharacterized protein LOC143589524 n=1 Tax=Bidens hawaiensis TaxID=980011 RepID=UPI00404AAD00
MEAQKFTMLHEIDVLRSTPSTIKVKLLKVWSVKDNNKPNEDFLIEMVFMDESGNRMQSTVFKQDIFRFKRYLNENATLTIVNPSLGSNASNYKVIDSPDKLVLNSSTHVNPCSQFDGPTLGFKFYSFKSVIDKEIPLKATIYNNSNLRHVKRNARLTMEVSDISGDSVYVTLWGDYVSQFSKYVVDHFDESHMIILMQFSRVKYHKEKPHVSNSYGSDVTRVFINDSISEIEDYKTRLFEFLDFNVDGAFRRPIPVKLMSTLDEEFLMATSFFNICEICTILLPKSIIVLGTIKAVCPDSEWYYVGCNSCSRKVSVTVVEGEDVYECKNQRCNTLGVTPTPMFKIKLRVQDGSGVVSLTLFDRDVKLIINNTTSELLATKDEEKKFAFKVEIADFNFRNNVEVYGISKLTDDQQIISTIEKRLIPEFIVPSDSGSLTFGNSLTDLQSTSFVSLKISENGDNKTPVSYRLVDDEVNEIKLSSSDSDGKLKRKLVDVFDGDQPSGFSFTKSKTSDVQGDSELVSVVGSSKDGVKFLTPKMNYPALVVFNQPFFEQMQLRDDQLVCYLPYLNRGRSFANWDVSTADGSRWTLVFKSFKSSIPGYAFVGEWPSLARHINLQVNDYLVFLPVDHNTLRLYVFDSRGVERKQFVQQNNIVDDDSFGAVDIEGERVWIQDEHVSNNFVEVIIRDRLRLPVQFARDNGLDKETRLVLINPNGEDVMTRIHIEYNHGNYKFRVHDWPEFVRLNSLELGKKCLLEYNRPTHSLIMSQEIPKEFILQNSLMFNLLPKTVEIDHYKGSSIVELKKHEKTVCLGDGVTDLLVQDLSFRDGDVLWLKYVNKSTANLRVYDKNGNLPRDPLPDVSNTTQSKNVQNVHSNPPTTCFFNGYSYPVYHSNQYDDTSTQLGSCYSSNRKQRKQIVDGCAISSNIIPNPTSNFSGSVSNYINFGNTSSKRRVGRPRKTTNTTPIPMQQLNDFEFVVDVFKGISTDYVDHGDQSFKGNVRLTKSIGSGILLKENPQIDFKLRIVGTRKYDARTYNLPRASEVAALIVGDIGDAMDKRDIIVNSRSGGLRRISELHPSYTHLQFPLLFLFGEDGYKVDIPHRNVDPSSTAARKKCTMREFFAYRLQDRPNQFSLTLNGRRLFQQLLVDKYTMVESQRLHFIRGKHSELRPDTYESLRNLKTSGN